MRGRVSCEVGGVGLHPARTRVLWRTLRRFHDGGGLSREMDTAVAFLEGRTIQPINQVIAAMQEVLLVMSCFRRHPQALRRTTPPEEWLA